VREPFVARWPGQIPAGAVCHEPAMTIDLLPTFAHLAGAQVPSDRIIDGKDITPLLLGQNDAHTPHEAFYFYWGNDLQAVRSGRWKLHLPHAYSSLATPGAGGSPGKYENRQVPLSLYDLESDPGETRNVAGEHADVVQRLEQLAEEARQDLGDAATNRNGKNARKPGRL
jgi:arylsulfatase A-like enzyme